MTPREEAYRDLIAAYDDEIERSMAGMAAAEQAFAVALLVLSLAVLAALAAVGLSGGAP